MKKILTILISSTVLVSPVLIAADQPSMSNEPSKQMMGPPHHEPFKMGREKLKNMTPEQREAFMKNAREKWEKLSPEERQKFKVQMREKMNTMKKQRAERKMVRIYSLYLLEQEQ